MTLLGFSIGPVQSFIASARTVRDLWAGSYLLSELTKCGMAHVKNSDSKAEIIFPVIEDETDPSAGDGRGGNRRSVLLACAPNLFVAEVPGIVNDRSGTDLSDLIADVVRKRWIEIATEVRQGLQEEWGNGDWGSMWEEQIGSFFDIRCVVVTELSDNYQQSYKHLIKVMAAGKTIRYVPPHEPEDESRPKCSITGVHAIMGPTTGWNGLKTWWGEVSKKSIEGTRVKDTEKLCAPSLVKRFAWACHWYKKLELSPDALRFDDTATIAAAQWLTDQEINIDPDTERKKASGWSGQWLHWPSPTFGVADGEKTVPEDLWKKILAAKKRKVDEVEGRSDSSAKRTKETKNGTDRGGQSSSKGKPVPTYYAVLMMDGDKMGDKVKAAAELKDGRQEHRSLSESLGDFAQKKVRDLIENDKHVGQLIYAGGDDVLAMLPSATVLDCAFEVKDQYRQCMAAIDKKCEQQPNYQKSTMSAGIVIAHYKSDLRFVLQEARDAEKRAKKAGRDSVCISVLKRSGEHERDVCKWDLVPDLLNLLNHFLGGASDRWAYQLSAEQPVLGRLCVEAQEAEIKRLMKRSEGVPETMQKTALDFWEKLDPKKSDAGEHVPEQAVSAAGLTPNSPSVQDTCQRHEIEDTESPLRRFCFFVKAMSFLARGRDS